MYTELPDLEKRDPAKYVIKDIRRGTGEQNIYIYGKLYYDGKLITSATLDYIMAKIPNIL